MNQVWLWAASRSLKGRYISARVVRPGLTMATIIPACRVGTLSGGLYSSNIPVCCADLTGREIGAHFYPRPDDLGWYVTPLQGWQDRSLRRLCPGQGSRWPFRPLLSRQMQKNVLTGLWDTARTLNNWLYTINQSSLVVWRPGKP